MSQEITERTPTEILIKCLEDFGRDEPDAALVVWTTKSGDIAWASSTERISLKVGMLELAKLHIMEHAKQL